MSKYEQQGLDELAAALGASLRAEAHAQREAGETGLNPELATAYAAGTLDDRAKAGVDRLTQGNPLAMEQLAAAIAALPEPVPVPSVIEVLLYKMGRAAADVVAKVKAYVQAYGEAALDRLLAAWQVITQPPVRALAAEGAAFAGRTAAPYVHDFDEVDGLRPSLVYQRNEMSLHVRGKTLDHADEMVYLILQGPNGTLPIGVYMEEQDDARVWGYSVLGTVREIVDELGTPTPEPTFLIAA